MIKKPTDEREKKIHHQKSLWGTFELNSSSDLNCFWFRFDNILVSTNLKSQWISKQCKKYHHHHHHHNKPLSQACTASKFNVYPRKKHIVDANFLCCQLLDSKRKRRKRKPNRIKHKNKRQWKWEWEWVKENEKENVLECHRSFCYFITKQVKNQYCKNFPAIKPPTLFSHAYEPNVCSLGLSSHSLRSLIREAWASSEHFAMWLRHTVWRAIQSIRITVRMDVNFVVFFVFARFFSLPKVKNKFHSPAVTCHLLNVKQETRAKTEKKHHWPVSKETKSKLRMIASNSVSIFNTNFSILWLWFCKDKWSELVANASPLCFVRL